MDFYASFAPLINGNPSNATPARVFSQLNVDEQQTLSAEEVIAICEDFKQKYQAFK